MHRQPSLPPLRPGAAARTLADVEILRTGRPAPVGATSGPLRTWAVVIGVAAALFLLMLALLYALSLATAVRPALG